MNTTNLLNDELIKKLVDLEIKKQEVINTVLKLYEFKTEYKIK